MSGLKIESWEDAKAHLSGMYGTNVEELFKEKNRFHLNYYLINWIVREMNSLAQSLQNLKRVLQAGIQV
ncbi:hypothetical protein SP19_3 [Salmonella phage 19]|nr:hypothetical protein SP19_3 [Salmonella phage 19]